MEALCVVFAVVLATERIILWESSKHHPGCRPYMYTEGDF